MKDGLDINSARNLFKQYANSKGWSLCIGAGTSKGVFPDWNQLIFTLIQDIESIGAEPIYNSLIKKYSLDALLQAGFELKGVNEDSFCNLLSDLLYQKINSMLSTDEFNTFVAVMSSISIDSVNKSMWKKFIVIRDKYFSNTSAYVIAKIISQTLEGNLRPSEIVTFNGEALLFALLNSFIYEKHMKKYPKGEVPVNKYITFVNRGICPVNKGQIPYIFNHGVLPVPNAKRTYISSSDKLVFKESEYLNLANSSYSWQSSMFLQICSMKPILFIGVSLSDPNMRRWLSWIQKNRTEEICNLCKSSRNSTLHYWIEEKPKDDHEAKWIEACVYHLGVRVIWIDKWTDLSMLLTEILGLY